MYQNLKNKIGRVFTGFMQDSVAWVSRCLFSFNTMKHLRDFFMNKNPAGLTSFAFQLTLKVFYEKKSTNFIFLVGLYGLLVQDKKPTLHSLNIGPKRFLNLHNSYISHNLV